MKQAASLLLALSLSAPLLAQTPAFPDPANLAGTRPAPVTGYELPIDQGVLGLHQLLRKLQTRASILNIVAHPDDEDGGMLTLNARGLGARVADLSLTRGEGGQNAMTGDFEDALGLLRTQELLANDRYTGVTQMFGTEVDFGFSKTKSEAFAKWTHDRVLYDAVRAIRIFRPLVITATFIGEPTDGHGQHQVSGQIAQEAFVAAGDPNVFPELTREGILPWQPLKMYARVPMGAISAQGLYDYATNQYVPARFTNYITHQTSTTPPTADITIHEGTPDPLLTIAAANPKDLPPSLLKQAPDTQLTYLQFARIGLGLQKSQIGPGVREARSGTFDVSYHLYGSRFCNASPSARIPANTAHPNTTHPSIAANENPLILSGAKDLCIPSAAAQPSASGTAAQPTFFDGVDTSIQSLEQYHTIPTDTLPRLAGDIDAAAEHFNPTHPEAIAPTLADALHIVTNLIQLTESSHSTEIEKYNALHELRIKRTQLDQALALSLGLSLDATANSLNQVSGDRFNIWLKLSTRAADLSVKSETVTNTIGVSFTPQALDDNRRDLNPGHAVQRNVKLEPNVTLDITRPYFTRDSIETPVYKLLSSSLRNAPSAPPALTAWADVEFRGETLHVGRVLHSGQQPVTIVPPIGISTSSPTELLLPGQKSVTVTVHAAEPSTGDAAAAPAFKVSLKTPAGWSLKSDILPSVHTFRLTPPSTTFQPTTVQAVATLAHNEFTEGFRSIGYGDLPRTNLYTPATTRIVPLNLTVPQSLGIAYLPGTGDDIPSALIALGYNPTLLKVSDLTPDNLDKYDTVILGVRTYNAHPDLHGAPTQALLDYAHNGGNVLVQFQTQEFTAADAPFPLSLGDNEKVVDETAPIALLTPSATLLTTPNKITPADFNNWFEERGHGFLSTWDAHYTALTETHDPGSPEEGVKPQLPQRGGLITTQVGKGRWTYCAFALYRQLPEANPGAFRLFINLITPPHRH